MAFNAGDPHVIMNLGRNISISLYNQRKTQSFTIVTSVGNLLFSGRQGITLVKIVFFLLKPNCLKYSRSSCPAGPIKGRLSSTSTRPGDSPTNMNVGFLALPSDGTTH